MGKRAQLFDSFPLGDGVHVVHDARAAALDRISNAWRGEDAPRAQGRTVSDCGCASCSGNRRATAQDRLSRATPGERYIARAMTMDSGSGARDAYQARMELAYLRPQAR